MKSTKPMKLNKPMKARHMWANQCEYGGIIYAYTTRTEAYYQGSDDDLHRNIHVAVIPLEDITALITKAGDAFSASYDGHLCQADIVAMLTAIGVLPKRRKGRK